MDKYKIILTCTYLKVELCNAGRMNAILIFERLDWTVTNKKDNIISKNVVIQKYNRIQFN